MATLQVTSALRETQTFDETTHLVAGYSYLKTGDFRMAPDHPPLGRMLNALPLLFLRLDFSTTAPAWTVADIYEFSDDFVYKNRVSADTILFAGRCVTILLTLALGLLVAAWTRRRFGRGVALTALALYAFCPNLIAHGRYVTTDLIVTLFFFLTVVLWSSFLVNRRRRTLLLAGLALGLALASKFSGLLLVPTLVALCLIHWWREPQWSSGWRMAGSLSVALAAALLVVALAYAPVTLRRVPQQEKISGGPDPSSLAGRTLHWTAEAFDLSRHPYLVGLGELAAHNQIGHSTYLLGRQSEFGSWYYFPVVFAVKSTTAVLVLLAFCVCVLLVRSRHVGRLRRARFEWFALAVPPLLYLALSMSSQINIGLRHILPIFPFLFILLAAIVWSCRGALPPRVFWALLGLVLGLHAIESLKIYPHYLAFFNWLAGGPENGPKYVLDSNIDWGQDVKELKKYVDQRRILEVQFCYFGRAALWYYGLNAQPIQKLERPEDADAVVAVSVTHLYGTYLPPENFAALRKLEPAARIGYSIYVYDLRKRR